jgi:hypothetical protein
MTRRATPQPGVDRMVSTSWSGSRWSSPAARQGRALARGLEGRLPLQHHHVSDQNSEFVVSGFFFSCPQTRYLPGSHQRKPLFICRNLYFLSLVSWSAGEHWRGRADAALSLGTYLHRRGSCMVSLMSLDGSVALASLRLR